MIDINWTLFVQIANFLVIIFVLNVIVYKPIRKILKQRKAKVDGLENNIQTISTDAEAKNQSFAGGIKEARLKGQQQKEALLQAAADEEKAIVAQINEKAQKDLAAVKENISRDIKSVQVALEKEVDTFADVITQKILGRAAS